MAIPCQGFTFTWGGSALTEVQSLDYSQQMDYQEGSSGRNGDRGSYTYNGEIRLVSFAPSVLNASQFGRSDTLTIRVPNGTTALTIFSGSCMYRGIGAQGKANEAVSFAHVFRVWYATKALSN